MTDEFVATRPSTPIGREVYNRGVAASLSEFCDALDSFLIPLGENLPTVAWPDFARRLRSMANEARGIEGRQ